MSTENAIFRPGSSALALKSGGSCEVDNLTILLVGADSEADNKESFSESAVDEGNVIVFPKEGVKVPIEPEVFARISPYFRAAFFGNFIEAKSRKITLLDKNILDIAAYLMLDPILEFISDVIISLVEPDNLVQAYHLAENRFQPLAEKLWMIIINNYNKLLKNKAYCRLTESEILRLIGDDRLNIKRSQELLMAREWLKLNDDEDGIRSTELCEAMKGKCDAIGFLESNTRVPNSVILASGGWSALGPTRVVEVLDTHANRWSRPMVKIFEQSRAYHASLRVGDAIYTMGGFNGVQYYRSSTKFDLRTRQCSAIAPMHDKRCYVSAGVMDENRIIVFGGYDNTERLRSCEILNISNNQWDRIAKLGIPRSDSHCAILNDVVYAVGGFDGSSYHQSIESYHVGIDEWLMIQNPMNSRRSGVACVAFNGCIIVCGGFDGTERLRSVESFDPREGIFHRLRSMRHQRSNFGIEMDNHQVIVAGGYDGSGTVCVAESYDFRADAWTDMPQMGIRRSALYLTRIAEHDIIRDLIISSPFE